MFNSPGMAQTACLDQLSGIHTNENHLHPLIKYNIKFLLQFGEVEKVFAYSNTIHMSVIIDIYTLALVEQLNSVCNAKEILS